MLICLITQLGTHWRHTHAQLFHTMRNASAESIDTHQYPRLSSPAPDGQRPWGGRRRGARVWAGAGQSRARVSVVAVWRSCSSHRKVSSSHSCRNAPPQSLSQILHYTKHTNFLFHSNLNIRWNVERNIFLLSSYLSMFLRVDAVFLRHKESKTWRNVVLGVSGLLTSYLSRGSTQVVFWLLWSIK